MINVQVDLGHVSHYDYGSVSTDASGYKQVEIAG